MAGEVNNLLLLGVGGAEQTTGDVLLLETGAPDNLLLETNDNLLLES